MASKRVSGLQFKSAASFRNLLLLCVAAGMSSALTRALFLRLALNNEWYVLVAGSAIAFVFTGAFFLALRRIVDEFIACDAVLRRLILALIVSGAIIAVLLAPSDQRTLTWQWAAGPQSGRVAPVFSGTSWDSIKRQVIELHATNNLATAPYGVWRVIADLGDIGEMLPGTLELWVTQPSWAVIDPATDAPPPNLDGVDVVVRVEKGDATLSEQLIALDPPVAPEQRSWRRVVVDLPADAERLSVEVAMRQTLDYDRVWITEATVRPVRDVRIARFASIALITLAVSMLVFLRRVPQVVQGVRRVMTFLADLGWLAGRKQSTSGAFVGHTKLSDPSVASRYDPIRDALLSVLLGMVIFFAQALLIKKYAIAVPLWDDWILTSLFKKHLTGMLSLSDLFEQHNEHRILTTKVLSLVTFSLMGNVWHPIANMLLSAVLNGMLAGVWMWTIARLVGWNWLTVLACLCLVSPVQWENMLWGFQIQFYVLLLSIVGGACILTLIGRLTWSAVIVAFGAMFIALFSLASGILACIALFAGLALLAFCETGSLRAMLHNRQTLLKLGVAGAGGVFLAVIFFTGYRFSGRMGMDFDLLIAALAYPITKTIDSPLWQKIIGLILIWGPITLVCTALTRYNIDLRLLVLFVVIGVSTVGTVWLIAIGRPGWITSRYMTVFLWFSVLSLLALAIATRLISVLPSIRIRRFLLLVCAIWGFTLIYFHAARALESFEEIEGGYVEWNHPRAESVRIFLANPSLLSEEAPIPFPSSLRETFIAILSDPMLPSFLPPEIKPGERFAPQLVEGNAWTLNGEYPSLGDTPFVRYGSWSGDDDYVGTFISMPLLIHESYLVLPVVGYPDRPGNRLAIETIGEPKVVIMYNGSNLHEHWGEWVVDVSALKGREVQIVAIDGAFGHGGWLGIGAPRMQNWQVTALYWFLDHLERVAAITLLSIAAVAFVFSNDAR